MDWRVSQIYHDFHEFTIITILYYTRYKLTRLDPAKLAVHQVSSVIDRQCGGNHKPKV